MRLKDLSFVLNKLNEQGFGEVQITTGEYVNFDISLAGIHMNDLKEIFPHNPFTEANVSGNGISPNIYIEDNEKIVNEFEVHKICKENRRIINENS